MRAHLTDVLVRGLKPVAGAQLKVCDTSTGGFGVLVNERSKSWIVMYGRKRTLKVIGRYPVVSLAEARLAAKKLLIAPPAEDAPPARPFIEVRDQFLETHGTTLRSQSRYQLCRTIRRYFVWNQPLDKITYNDVATVIDAIKAKSEAAHALKDIKTFFNWCVPRFIPHSPRQGIKSPKRYTPRSRYLSDEELKAVWRAAEEMGFQYGKRRQLLITTGQRRNQISSLRWSWIDEKKKCIHFPAEVMKGGRDHWLPYSELTASILATIPRMGDLLFPARGKDKPATNKGKIKETLDKRSGVSNYTIHDLRRTMTVGLQKCRVSVELIETLLSHRSGVLGGIVGVCQRHDFKDEMRAAVEAWEAKLSTIVMPWWGKTDAWHPRSMAGVDPLRAFAAANCGHSKLGVISRFRENVFENEFREALSDVSEGSESGGEALQKRFLFERAIARRETGELDPTRTGYLSMASIVCSRAAGEIRNRPV